MASYTANYNLRKDASTEKYDVAVVNQNLDEIDAQMHQNEVASTTPFTGASSSENGAQGIVPRPMAGDQEKYLKGDGTWGTPSGGGGGSDVTITPTLATGRKIAEFEIDGVGGELYAPDPSVPTKRYLGQLIPRVSGADSHISSSGKTVYGGGENWHAFDGDERINGVSYCWSADENNTAAYIQYHFDSAYYFTQIQLKLYSHHGSTWTGNLNVLGSNDGATWTNIASTGSSVSVTAPLNTMNTETIALDDSQTWEYIRVQADNNAFNIAYQPACDFAEIYVYGGDIVNGIDASTIDFSTLTAAQILYLKQVLDIQGGE